MKRRQEAAEEAERLRLQAEAGWTEKRFKVKKQNYNIILQIKELRKKRQSDKQKLLLEIKPMLELLHAKKLVCLKATFSLFFQLSFVMKMCYFFLLQLTIT